MFHVSMMFHSSKFGQIKTTNPLINLSKDHSRFFFLLRFFATDDGAVPAGMVAHRRWWPGHPCGKTMKKRWVQTQNKYHNPNFNNITIMCIMNVQFKQWFPHVRWIRHASHAYLVTLWFIIYRIYVNIWFIHKLNTYCMIIMIQ